MFFWEIYDNIENIEMLLRSIVLMRIAPRGFKDHPMVISASWLSSRVEENAFPTEAESPEVFLDDRENVFHTVFSLDIRGNKNSRGEKNHKST